MTLGRGEPTPHAVAGTGLERELEALLTDGARGADRLRLVGLGLRRREEDVGVDGSTGGIVEPLGLGHIYGETGHSWPYNAVPRRRIPIPTQPNFRPTFGSVTWNHPAAAAVEAAAVLSTTDVAE
jgi:hypothetical protein